jgi:hypothetical protein
VEQHRQHRQHRDRISRGLGAAIGSSALASRYSQPASPHARRVASNLARSPGSDSQGNPDFRKITRNQSLIFAAFGGDTGHCQLSGMPVENRPASLRTNSRSLNLDGKNSQMAQTGWQSSVSLAADIEAFTCTDNTHPFYPFSTVLVSDLDRPFRHS